MSFIGECGLEPCGLVFTQCKCNHFILYKAFNVFYIKLLMRSGWSYIRDSGDFIDKMKRIGKVPEGSFLVTADVVGLYPSIPHKERILALKCKLEEQTSSKVPTNDLVKLAEFVLKNNFFEFNNQIKQ